MKKTSHHRRHGHEKNLILAPCEAMIRDEERQSFLEGVNADFAALRNNPTAWQKELAERATWDCTLADGLKDE